MRCPRQESREDDDAAEGERGADGMTKDGALQTEVDPECLEWPALVVDEALELGGRDHHLWRLAAKALVDLGNVLGEVADAILRERDDARVRIVVEEEHRKDRRRRRCARTERVVGAVERDRRDAQRLRQPRAQEARALLGKTVDVEAAGEKRLAKLDRAQEQAVARSMACASGNTTSRAVCSTSASAASSFTQRHGDPRAATRTSARARRSRADAPSASATASTR